MYGSMIKTIRWKTENKIDLIYNVINVWQLWIFHWHKPLVDMFEKKENEKLMQWKTLHLVDQEWNNNRKHNEVFRISRCCEHHQRRYSTSKFPKLKLFLLTLAKNGKWSWFLPIYKYLIYFDCHHFLSLCYLHCKN